MSDHIIQKTDDLIEAVSNVVDNLRNENTKLKEQLAVAVEALGGCLKAKDKHESYKILWCDQYALADKALKQIKEMM